MMVMHSAHNEGKQETIVNILLEHWGTSKKNNTQSEQSARPAQSAVCSLHGLRFNMTEALFTERLKTIGRAIKITRDSTNNQ